MKKGATLVTGGTGFLGRHLLDALGEQVRNLRILSTRPPKWLREKKVEVLEGSLSDPAVAAQAVAGAERIYHLAGFVSRDPDDGPEMYRIHVEGTRNLCRAAVEASVGRIVLCSTSGTIAVTEDGKKLPDETHPRPLGIIARWPYYLSKLYQENVAAEICAGKVELVTVCPSLVLGPGDDRLSSTIDVQRVLEEKISVVPPGGLSFVDARDAAQALVAAMERGRSGETYLVGGPNWTFETFLGRVARLADVSSPKVKAGEKIIRWGATAMDVAYRHFGRKPPLDKTSAEMSTYFWYLDNRKATEELGFIPRDPSETLSDTVRYLRNGGSYARV